MVGTVLGLASLLLYPGWPIPFLRAVSNNLRIDYGLQTGPVLSAFVPGFGSPLQWLTAASALLLMGAELRGVRGSEAHRLPFASAVFLAATPLLGQRSESEHLIVLMFPWALVARAIQERWPFLGGWLVTLVLSGALAASWSLASLPPGIAGLTGQELAFVALPTVTLIALYWVRWWTLRAPLTWTESVSGSRAPR
jgi:hypothetical protein